MYTYTSYTLHIYIFRYRYRYMYIYLYICVYENLEVYKHCCHCKLKHEWHMFAFNRAKWWTYKHSSYQKSM